MNDLKVIDWISFDEAQEKTESIGGMGGFYKDGMRGQKDYFDEINDEKDKPYYEALRKEILEKKIKCGGDVHQQDMTPVFSDNTAGSFTMRAWGDLMAAIWSQEEDKDYNYMDFYMQCLMPKEDIAEEKTQCI